MVVKIHPRSKYFASKLLDREPVDRVDSTNLLTFSHTTPLPLIERSKMADLKIRNRLVGAEIRRLNNIFKDIDADKMKIVSGLIRQTARLKILLDEMWIDITEKGDYELFSQSDSQTPYERERPVAKQYNSRDQAYQRAIKQLTDYLPEEKREIAESAAIDGSDLL